MNEQERTLPIAVVILVAITIAIGAIVVAASFVGSSGQAVDDNIACNDDVPAGWDCVPLVNKPDSGPGVTSNAIGELLFKFPDAKTLWVSLRSVPGGGAIALSDAQFCMDDDEKPYNTAGGPNQGNQFHDCTGKDAANEDVDDGTGNIPPADDGEEDEGANGLYEIRVKNISTTPDGTADGLDFSEFSDVEGYLFFVFHVNIDQSSTQAFFELIPPPTTTPTPTPSTPTPTPTPGAEASPTPTPTALAEVQEPEALPASGGAPAEGSNANLALLLGLGGLALLSGAGTLVAVKVRRRR